MCVSGLSWAVKIFYTPPNAYAGLQLSCSFRNPLWGWTQGWRGAGGVSASVEVHTCKGEKHVVEWRNVHVPYNGAWGWDDALPLEVAEQCAGQQGQAADGAAADEATLLAPWTKLLGPEGSIRGTITFFRPGRGQQQQQGPAGSA